jgi:hypothetical protein
MLCAIIYIKVKTAVKIDVCLCLIRPWNTSGQIKLAFTFNLKCSQMVWIATWKTKDFAPKRYIEL